MSTEALTSQRVSIVRFPGLAPAGRVARQTLRGALIWGVVLAFFWWLLVNDFTTNYPTPADLERLVRETQANIGMQALFGPPHHLDTVAGYAAWHGTGFLGIITAVWGLLTGTRLLRGEEEAGRWEFLLAGQTTRRRAAARAVAGLGAGLLVLWVLNALGAYLFGRAADPPFSLGGSMYLAVAVVAPAGLFLAVGALCSQLAGSRRQAAWLATIVFGVAYAIRLIAYTDASVLWLRWVSPLAWVDELRPLTDNRLLPLLPIMALLATLVTATIVLAGRRDLGAAIVPARDTAPARTGLLTGPFGLALRLARPGALGWITGLAIAGLIVGFLAKTSADVFANASGGALEALGGAGGGEVYLGVVFLIVALLVTLAACGLLGATRDEETGGCLDNLLVRPVARPTWLTGRFVVSTAVLVTAGAAVGLSTWVGAAIGNADIGPWKLLAAGLNVVPAGIFVLGVGTLTHGLAPRHATAVAYGVVAWSFIAEIVGAGLPAGRWLRNLSVLHHITRAPAEEPRWGMAAVLVAVGVAAAIAGMAVFTRRDLQST